MFVSSSGIMCLAYVILSHGHNTLNDTHSKKPSILFSVLSFVFILYMVIDISG